MAIENELAKVRWGELEEDDGEDLDFLLLPARQVIGPDENGIKRVVEYRFDDDGNKVKITTTTRIRKLANARLSKCAVERRSWPKFGDAVRQDVGARLTMVSTEEIVLERPKPLGSSKEDAKNSDPSAQFNKGAVLMVCRTCGKKADHWTASCPYKSDESFVDIPPTDESYLRWRNDENSVRVTNLSEDTWEPDLLELFSSFAVDRVYVAIDQKTGMSRGFGFVKFVSREDAQRAIDKLNGYGYDNLILRIEWANPMVSNCACGPYGCGHLGCRHCGCSHCSCCGVNFYL